MIFCLPSDSSHSWEMCYDLSAENGQLDSRPSGQDWLVVVGGLPRAFDREVDTKTDVSTVPGAIDR